MTPYKNLWDFYRDTARLVEEGATLRTLYDAMLGVQSEDMRAVQASPKRLREMAQGWSQRPNFFADPPERAIQRAAGRPYG